MENSQSQELINKAIEWIESSSDFVKGQWPDFVNQYMRAAIIKAWVDTFILSIGLIICVIGFFYLLEFNPKNKDKLSYDFLSNCMPFILGILSLPIIGGLISEIHNLINIYVAPKVYILSHLKDFLK